MHVHIYICIHACIYVYIYIYIYSCVYIYVYIHIKVPKTVDIVAYVHTYLFINWGGGFWVLPRLVPRLVPSLVGSLVPRVVPRMAFRVSNIYLFNVFQHRLGSGLGAKMLPKR